MAEVFDFDGAGERYKFLLQPLKDLASNWDVDIAKTLEEYIQKVVEENDSAVLVDQNGRRKVFNFTEAALLIHGTTSVYVKKVDYVHQLALNFFDQLREDPQPDKKRKKVNQPDNEDVDQVEDNVENGSGMEEILVPKEKHKLKVNYAAMHTLLERLTHRQAPSFPRVPISFIPLSDHEKSDVPLFTRTNAKEQIGKKDDFRINSCHIYESVALLDIKNISMVDKITPFHKHDLQMQQAIECTLRTRYSSPQQSLDPILDQPNDEDDGEEEFIQQQQKENINANNEGIVPFNGDEEDEFEDGMEEIIAEEILPAMDDNIAFGGDDDNVYLDPQDVIKEQSRPYKKKLNCIINADKQIKARERRIERECKEKGVPNECSIKNYIDSQMFRKRLRKRNFVFGQFNAFLMDQAVLALNPLIYEEEKRRNDFRKKKRKENQAIERALRARHRSSQQSLDPVLDHPNDEDDGEEEFIQQQQKENINANTEGIVPFNGDEEDEFEDGMEEIIAEEILPAMDDNMTFGGDDDNETNLGDILELDDLQNSLGGIQNMYSGFQHLISSKIRDKNALASKLAKNMRNDYDDTRIDCDLNPEDLPNRPPSQMNYDEIIAFHLRKYWTSSEAAVSKFSERMQMWEAKMGLALEEERKHREFDTREYGDEVVNFFDGKIGNEVDFTQVLGSIPNGYDRSRYLLVTLILANMGNLEINVTDNSSNNESQMLNYSLEMATSPAYSEKMDHIHLKLLKLERHHQVFEDEQRLLNGNPQD